MFSSLGNFGGQVIVMAAFGFAIVALILAIVMIYLVFFKKKESKK